MGREGLREICSDPLQVCTESLHIRHITARDDPPPAPDALYSLTGSQARADFLGALFTQRSRLWSPPELGRVTGHPHQTAYLELQRLADAGLVRVTVVEGRRQYEPETEDPVARELARFLMQTRGAIPAVRAAVESLPLRTLAWLSADEPYMDRARSPGRVLVALTSVPKRIVHQRLAASVPNGVEVHPISMAEWVTRLQRRELFARRARRGAKIWVVGSPGQLIRWEQAHLASRTTLRNALDKWREELSDEWDGDWDPMAGSGSER